MYDLKSICPTKIKDDAEHIFKMKYRIRDLVVENIL